MFRLGCAVWSYKDWVGELYPQGSRAADFLKLYGQRMTAVEGNTTFYATPDQSTVARWVDETPPEFSFCLKLPRDVTHNGYLMDNGGVLNYFLHQVEALSARPGPFFAQLPPSYGPEYFADLDRFLARWPVERLPLALEVRHPDWFKPRHAERLNTRLALQGIGRVLLDTRPVYDGPDDPQLGSERRKPPVPLQPERTAAFTLIRFISHPQAEANQAYLEEWAERIDGWLREGTAVYCFMHCPQEVHSPARVRTIQTLLEARGAPVPPLPWLTLPPEPEPTKAPGKQLTLFG